MDPNTVTIKTVFRVYIDVQLRINRIAVLIILTHNANLANRLILRVGIFNIKISYLIHIVSLFFIGSTG